MAKNGSPFTGKQKRLEIRTICGIAGRGPIFITFIDTEGTEWTIEADPLEILALQANLNFSMRTAQIATPERLDALEKEYGDVVRGLVHIPEGKN